MGLKVMSLCLIVLAPSCWCQGRAGISAASYTSNLLPSLSRREGRVGGMGIGIGAGIGQGGTGSGVGAGIDGFDDFGNPIGGGLAGARGTGGQGHHISKCGPIAPECLATPIDKDPECKYVYDVTIGGCVKIDVSLACGVISGGAANIFSTVTDCERYCLQ